MIAGCRSFGNVMSYTALARVYPSGKTNGPETIVRTVIVEFFSQVAST